MTTPNLGATAYRENPIVDNRPGVVIYTHSLLAGSMTFIKSQAEALEHYHPVYVGAHRVNGIELPERRTYVLNEHTLLGVVREAMFRQWGLAPALVKKIRPHRPQIVHAHFGTCGPAGMALAEQLQIPFIVTFHGQDATMSRTEALKSYRGREMLNKKDRIQKKAGAIIAVSDYIRRRLIEQGYPESKLELLRNGIDLNFFKPDNNASRAPIMLFVGRFVEKKGASYLIEAATKLHESGVEFQLVMIGNGPLESHLKDAAAKARIPCRFLGFLTVEEVRHWLQKASVVAIPSVVAANGDSEGLPTNLLEAQAMQTPVVATRHSGIPEGVKEGITAELVEERDVSALADKLRSFLCNPAKVRTFGEAGRSFVAENFDMRSQVSRLENIYADVYARYMA